MVTKEEKKDFFLFGFGFLFGTIVSAVMMVFTAYHREQPGSDLIMISAVLLMAFVWIITIGISLEKWRYIREREKEKQNNQ